MDNDLQSNIGRCLSTARSSLTELLATCDDVAISIEEHLDDIDPGEMRRTTHDAYAAAMKALRWVEIMAAALPNNPTPPSSDEPGGDTTPTPTDAGEHHDARGMN